MTSSTPSIHSAANDKPQIARHAPLVLFGTVFVTGAAVMLIEVLGSRIIGPVFGATLFVWAALLAVTLSALALGYYTGGVLVDRRPVPQVLGLSVAAAGFALAIVPLLVGPVLEALISLGPRVGPWCAALALFAPSLWLLGMAGPIAARLAIRQLTSTGRHVGNLYAISTVGSLLGTLATAFWLIPAFEVDHILAGCAAVLILLGAALLAGPLRLVGVAVLLPALTATPSPIPLPAGFTVVGKAHSPYSLVQVVDDQPRHVRWLRADHSVIGAQFLNDRTAGFAFLHALEVLRFMRPEAQRLLVIGLGTGALPMALERYSAVQTDVVEIDPSVALFAQRYFGFVPSGNLYIEDARTFIGRTDRRYDLVVHDTFTGGSTPEHLLSAEVFQDIRRLLRPGGVLALNFVGYQQGPHAEATRAVLTTLRAQFPHVRVFRDSDPNVDVDELSNVLFFASESTLAFNIPASAAFENPTCESIVRHFTRWEILQNAPAGVVITDARNPLARLQLAAAENHYYSMGKLLPPEVWLQR